MSHYYQNDPNLKSDFHEIQYTFYNHILDFTSDSGVFSKNRVDYGTNRLLNSLSEDLNDKKILDLGCGYGIIGITIGKAFPKAFIEMTDVNERAVLLAKKNAIDNKVNNVQIYVSNLYDMIESSFDKILTNPPIRAGKEVVFGIVEEGFHHLQKGGAIRLVIQKKQGAPSLMKKMEEIYSNVKVVNKENGYYILESIKI